MTTQAAAAQTSTVLHVDATVHSAELARFTRFVVRGPAPRDCWLWTGAIADDGDGRFWLNRNGHTRLVRPHRYALALARHLVLHEDNIVMHEVCAVALRVAWRSRRRAPRGRHPSPEPGADGTGGARRWTRVAAPLVRT